MLKSSGAKGGICSGQESGPDSACKLVAAVLHTVAVETAETLIACVYSCCPSFRAARSVGHPLSSLTEPVQHLALLAKALCSDGPWLCIP